MILTRINRHGRALALIVLHPLRHGGASLYTHLIDEVGHADVDKTHAIGEETSGSDCVE